MVMNIDNDTLAALQDARSRGIMPRYMLRIVGKNRSTGESEPINIWTGELTQGIPVINPKTQLAVTRTYQAANTWLRIPPIPQKLELEARSIRLTFSRLPAPVINAIRLYDPKMGEVEIHRGLFDPATHNLIAPAYCIFSGFVNKAPIKVPAAGKEGTVEMEVSSYSRFLTRTSGSKFSDEYLKRRGNGDRFGQYLDVSGLWRIFWGEDEKELNSKEKKRETWSK